MSGDHQNMNGSLWVKIVEGYDVLITIDEVSGNISASYLAKNTFTHQTIALGYPCFSYGGSANSFLLYRQRRVGFNVC